MRRRSGVDHFRGRLFGHRHAAERNDRERARRLHAIGLRRHIDMGDADHAPDLDGARPRDQAIFVGRGEEADLKIDGYREPAGRHGAGDRPAAGVIREAGDDPAMEEAVRLQQVVVLPERQHHAARQRLANGRYDLILTALGAPSRGHRQAELMTDRQALAVSARAFPRGPISPDILSGQPLIVRMHCEQLQLASRVLDAWKVRPKIVAQTDSDARALAMVAAGLGFCLMPDSFEHQEVRMLRSDDVELSRRLGFEWVRGAANGWLDRALDRL